MSKKEIYLQIFKEYIRIRTTEDKLSYFQELLKQNKYTKYKDMQAFIEGYISRFLKDYTKAEEHFTKSIKIDDKSAFSYNGLGNLYYDQEKYDKAEKNYKLSIEKDKNSPIPYYNLGISYIIQKNYDEAEEYFNLSIKKGKNYPAPYNGLGDLYKTQEKYDKAEKNYKLSIEKDKNFPFPYNKLGILYYDQKKYEKAQKYYELAIKIDDSWGGYHFNLALMYNKIQDLKKAKTEYEKALILYKKRKDEYHISLTQLKIKELKTRIKSQDILEDKTFKSIKDLKIKNILKTIKDKKIDRQIEENKEKYFEFLEIPEENNNSTEDAYFEVLRRWNSYTPIVANSFHSSKGGGYFIKIGTKGIVIDPGFNFIDNFRGGGYKFNELTTVLISHAHNDHTSDLESILTLLYKYNKNLKKKLPNLLAKSREEKIEDIKEDLIEKEYNRRRKVVDFFVTKSVFMKYSGLFDLHSKNDYAIHIIEKDNSYRIITNFWFYTFDAKHDDIISDRDAVGFLFNFNDLSLIYSGDSGWSKKIEKQYNNLVKNRAKDYIILLAHIGGFKESERDYLSYKGKEREKCLYKNHLGRIGLCRINETLNPKVCLISEFGEEFTNHRINIAKIYQEEFKDEIIFIPADIGLKFCLKKKQFEVVTEINDGNNPIVLGYVNPDEVMSCLMEKDYSLHYYKKNSGFSESQFIQKVIKIFDKSTQQFT